MTLLLLFFFFFACALLCVFLSCVLLKDKSRVADCLLALVQAALLGSRSNYLNGEQTAVSMGCASLGEASGEGGRSRMNQK